MQQKLKVARPNTSQKIDEAAQDIIDEMNKEGFAVTSVYPIIMSNGVPWLYMVFTSMEL